MKSIKKYYSSFNSSIKAKRSLRLLLANLIGLPLGVITSILLSKVLGVKGFGDYSFVLSVISLAGLLITFGFFQAGNRALVLNRSLDVAKQYYGVMAVVLIILSALLLFSLYLYGLYDANLKSKKLNEIFILILPLGMVVLSGRYVEVLLQADERIDLLSFYRIFTKILFLLFSLVLFYLINATQNYYSPRNLLITSIYLYIASQLLVFIIVLFNLKPSRKNIVIRFKEVLNYNKIFGFNVYLGSVLAVGFASLSQILISYYSEDNSGVGFYTLAMTFCSPLLLIPNTISTVYYKEFSTSKSITNKLLIITLFISLFAMLTLWLLIQPFIVFFYGDEFTEVAKLSYIVSFGVIAHGFGDFYNRFLGAHGQSIALRNSALIVGVASICIGIILIPKFGVYGAAITSLISGFIYLIAIYAYYFHFLNSREMNS